MKYLMIALYLMTALFAPMAFADPQSDSTSNIVYAPESSDGYVIGAASTSLVGFYGATPVDRPAALTAQLTTLTPADAEGTPDYATAAITNSSPFGFASAQEAITVLYVIVNLQARLAEVEARLEELGLVTSN